jgi:hypothetical protein
MKDRIRKTAFALASCTAVGLVLLVSTACHTKHEITQDELVRRTQELFENLAAGDQAPWKKYFAEDCMYFDEKGRNMNKAALIADITPLPTGYSGTIKVVNAHSHIERNVAIMSYDMNETETVFGQNMTARYHATDTWMHRKGQWQIVAGQVLRYYEDPASGKVDSAKFKEYLGTYELAPRNRLTITLDGQQLYVNVAISQKVNSFRRVPTYFSAKVSKVVSCFAMATTAKLPP